jgi:DNA-binding LytR/AlgR family response regulator
MQTYFFIRTSKRYVKISYNELIYIESIGNYARIVVDSGAYLAQLTIKQLEKILPVDSFYRVNRGCIVAIERISSFDCDSITVKNTKLPFTERYRKEFEKRVNIITYESIKPGSLKLGKELETEIMN